MSKNIILYKALDKLIDDYKVYKDNFPQDYYVEFGKYMVEENIKIFLKYYQSHLASNRIKVTGLVYYVMAHCIACCIVKIQNEMLKMVLLLSSYENYVSKFDGDENGLDKVLRFLYSAMLCFLKDPSVALVAGYIAEILDWAKQKIGKDGMGFDKGRHNC